MTNSNAVSKGVYGTTTVPITLGREALWLTFRYF
jgi:hypothetical protein